VSVLPFTFAFWEPVPKSPALFTAAAEPEDIDITCVKLRVVSGTAVMVLLSTKVPLEDVAGSLSWHWHITFSVDAPASSLALRTEASETFTINEAAWEALNPSAEKVTSQVPGESSENPYRPFASVLVVCVWPVAALIRVTVAPGTTAPVESVTVPLNAPVVADWAHKEETLPARTTIRRVRNVSDLSPFDFTGTLKCFGGIAV